MSKLLYHSDTFKIIGRCYEVHSALGPGFLEIVYKDALEYEFRQLGIAYGREVKFDVFYKGAPLKHHFFADFTAYDKIILEIKSSDDLNDIFYAQTINYLKVSGYKIALLINFGQQSLQYKRFIL